MRPHRLSSSVRECSPEATLFRASVLGTQLGISRVTDITRLDVIGLPVFASVRPAALPGSLCVNAGKGVRPIEARVGAWMEAIEFAIAERPRARLTIESVAAQELSSNSESNRWGGIFRFCPALGSEIPASAPIACVVAEDVTAQRNSLVPAELVFMPMPSSIETTHWFGTSSNGLASGNSVVEASVHALCELIERDIHSFQKVRDSSVSIIPHSLTGDLAALVDLILSAGLKIHLRTVFNEFGIPWFGAWIVEPYSHAPVRIADGYGCHPVAEIAAIRAVCEAAQSRLSFIHGGRDDITERYGLFSRMAPGAERSYTDRLERMVSCELNRCDFGQVEDMVLPNGLAVGSMWEGLVCLLADRGFRDIYRVELSAPSDTLSVVRLIVPGLEQFERIQQRVGIRLRNFVALNE